MVIIHVVVVVVAVGDIFIDRHYPIVIGSDKIIIW
jgi:hypothetical protein